MKIVAETHLIFRQGETPDKFTRVEVARGEHEVETIPSPIHSGGSPWIVLRGTKVGLPEGRIYCDPNIKVTFEK